MKLGIVTVLVGLPALTALAQQPRSIQTPRVPKPAVEVLIDPIVPAAEVEPIRDRQLRVQALSPTYAQVEANIKAYVGKKVTWTGTAVSDYVGTTAGRTGHLYVFIITPAGPPGTINRFRVRLTEPLQYPRRIGSIVRVTGTVSGAHRDSKGNESPELRDVSIAAP